MRKVTDNFGLIVILVATAIFCSACGSNESSVNADSSIIKESVDSESVSVLKEASADLDISEPEPKAPYADDYEYLWEVLRNTYPYLPYLEEQGVTVEDIYASYEEKIKNIEDEDKFYLTIQGMLSELRNFAHLDVVSPELYESYCYYTALKEAVSYEDKAYHDVLTNNNLSERYVMPDSYEDFEKQAGTNQHNKIFIQYYSDCNTLYIRIPSFNQELINRDKNLISDSLEQYPDTEHIIFDITGNSGGSWEYWMNNLISPFGGHYKFTYRTFYKNSPEFEKYHGDLETDPISELSDVPDWVSELDLDLCITTTFNLPDKNIDGDEVDQKIERWVLTSGNVFSASEAFTSFCKTSGWATIVGTKTSGDSLHTTPILVLLPDSGLIIRLSDGVGENPDGSINAVSGTMPDILCKKGETALGRCLELIRAGE